MTTSEGSDEPRDSGERGDEPVDRDEGDRQLLDDIRRHGWHVVVIEADDEGPGFAYSIGLFRSFGHPEMLVIGLDNDVNAGVVNGVGELVRGGKRFEHLDECGDVLDGYDVAFRRVDPARYPEYVGYARWYHGGADFPLLQCVWPDARHRYPWHPDFPGDLAVRQPVLGHDRSWSFHEGKNRACFTTRQVLGGSPILLVGHDEGGDWQFLCGTSIEPGDVALVSLGSMLARDGSLARVADLPEGWTASRAGTDGPWLREPSE